MWVGLHNAAQQKAHQQNIAAATFSLIIWHLQHLVACIIQGEEKKTGYYVYSIKATPVVFVCVFSTLTLWLFN
jgi:hypothetical protein